ncbi:MAG: Rossmann-like domain-containing protein [Anaerolineaceae bacterium]
MKPILQDLLDHLREDHPVKNIGVYAHSILVTSRFSGMASTILSSQPHAEEQISQAGDLLKKTALQLAVLCTSTNSLEAGIGLAAINSLIEPPSMNLQSINVAGVLEEKGQGKKIVLIGHFPFIPRLQKIAKALWVIDLNPAAGEFSPSDAPRFLPQADIVAMTANTLITHAAEEYISLCNPAALKIMLGPSTPMSPILFEHGLDILAGIRITDVDMVQRFLSQGASFSQVRGAEKITLSK